MGIHPNFHFPYHLPSSLCAEKGDEVLQIVCITHILTLVLQLSMTGIIAKIGTVFWVSPMF